MTGPPDGTPAPRGRFALEFSGGWDPAAGRRVPAHRMLIAGMTQTGKSTLATHIANAWDRILVYDPKGDPGSVPPNATIAYGVKAALRALPGRIVYRPTAPENARLGEYLDELARKLLELGGAHGLVIHELGDLGTTDRELPPFISAVWRQGASQAIPIIAVTQRPFNVPQLAFSEGQIFACFHLVNRRDRERMAEVMGDRVATDPIGPGHEFYLRTPDLRLERIRPLAL